MPKTKIHPTTLAGLSPRDGESGITEIKLGEWLHLELMNPAPRRGLVRPVRPIRYWIRIGDRTFDVEIETRNGSVVMKEQGVRAGSGADPIVPWAGWKLCPICCDGMRRIKLIQRVEPDMPIAAFVMTAEEKIGAYAEAGEHVAEFNKHGAATVRMVNGKQIGVKPSEFQWLSPVPPYDRWCDGTGAGQVHQ